MASDSYLRVGLLILGVALIVGGVGAGMAGYPTHVLFICSVPLHDRTEYAEKALDVQGVVNVREMLAGDLSVRRRVGRRGR